MVIKQNDWIEVDYSGKLNSGELFDTSKDREPLKFKVGTGMVIPGFDLAVINMAVGDKKEFKVPFMDAYGPKNTDVVEIPKESFKEVEILEKGKSLTFMTNLGPLKIDVVDILDNKVKAIVNHPLAGEDLTFNIEIKTIFSQEEGDKFDKEMESMHHNHCSCEDGSCEDDCSCDDFSDDSLDKHDHSGCSCGHKH